MAAPANKLMPVAKVIKSFGIKGEFIIRYLPSFSGEIIKGQPVFITYDGLPVPFFVSGITERGTDQAIVCVNEIKNPEEADEICGENIYIVYDSENEEAPLPSPSDFIGHSLVSTTGDTIGTIQSFYDYPGNPCFGIVREKNNGEELLLPVHEDIVTDIYPDKKIIIAEIKSSRR